MGMLIVLAVNRRPSKLLQAVSCGHLSLAGIRNAFNKIAISSVATLK